MEDTINAFHRLFSIGGVLFYSKHDTHSTLWTVLQIINCLVAFFCFVFTTGCVVSNYSNLLVFIEAACIWTTGVMMAISVGICNVFKNKLRIFVMEMVFKDGILTMPIVKYALYNKEGGKKLLQLKNMVTDLQENLMKYSRNLLKCYVLLASSVATLYLLSPIYEMVSKADPNLRLLAFDMWFPWSFEKMGVYIASFIFHAYAGYMCCIFYPGLQVTILLLIGQIVRHIRIVVFIMENLNELTVEIIKGKDDMWQCYCSAILAQCVDHYIKLKRFSNRLNVICQPFYLTQILVSLILVCMCSVKIAVSKKLALETIKYYLHECIFVLVLLIFCLIGQQVNTECERLELAITHNWYIFNKKHKMNVRIFRTAASQGMPIYIFGSIQLNLPTFTWFIKSGMSFFTLMMSVLEEIEQ